MAQFALKETGGRARRSAALVFILVTILIDVIGVGLVIPVLPTLVKQLAGSEAQGARFLGIFAAVYSLMQFACSPVLGALSDRFGRRPILLLSLCGTAFDYGLLYFAPSLGWLFLGRTIAGILGASVTVANAYIADVSPPEQMARNFGITGAMFGLGFIAGPALGGFLGNINLRLPFAFAAVLALLNALYGLFVLPESLSPSNRSLNVDWKSLNPLRTLGHLTRYPLVRNLVAAMVLFGLGQQSIYQTWVLFTEATLRWSPAQNGAALAVVGVMAVIVQAGLVGLTVRLLGERITILFGLTIGSLQLLIYGATRSDLTMYGAIIVGGIGGVAFPALQGLISKQVAPSEQGLIQGSIASLNSLVGMAGPILMTAVFAYFNGGGAPYRIPGASFYVGALFSFLGAIAAGFVLRGLATKKEAIDQPL